MKHSKEKILHVVHCIDTEGPLTETVSATFQRLNSVFGVDLPATLESLAKLQRKEIDLGGKESAVAKMVAPELLAYNTNWEKIQEMLDELLSTQYRNRMLDDRGRGWVYSWHCMDHFLYPDNPRHKDVGYGNVFRYYKNALFESGSSQDELNWHFHPVSITGSPLCAATSYANSYSVLNELLARRVIEDQWFPSVNRPGFHSERQDSNAFLEQWIPFDYANQFYESDGDQPDLVGGRFGDWRRASDSWRGYNPDFRDYQVSGACRRRIFRCLNVGTRLRCITVEHVRQAFSEAEETGCAILSFADHDYRDMRPDVEAVREMISAVRPGYPGVSLRFSGAEEAARDLLGVLEEPKPKLEISLEGNQMIVELLEGEIFGSQPFLALKGRDGRVFHDNFDIQTPDKTWTYIFDEQTINISALSKIGAGTAGRYGGYDVALMDLDQ